MHQTFQERAQEALGERVREVRTLHGGCVGEVYELRLAGGTRLVAKVDDGPHPALDREAYMLEYLARVSELPVPGLRFSSPRLLIMTFIQGENRFGAGAERHAAHLLAGLHALRAAQYGLAEDTLIGSLPQPNPWTDNWLDFFREQRLLYMAREAERGGRLPRPLLQRLEQLAEHLDRWLTDPAPPSLIHGDVWTTNVLAKGERITGFIDPAIYYADPEIELAFITLFGTFGNAFFEEYATLSSIRPGFFEERRDLYNLYPLLVHVRLFGGGYVSSVDRIVTRFGF